MKKQESPGFSRGEQVNARHQLARPRIRVAGREGKLKIVKPSVEYPGTVTLIWGDCWEDAALEEPCEVLP